MILYLIRHGDPDYSTNTLTPLGHEQSEACANRLAEAGVDRIYASNYGRAIETAEHLARKTGLEIGIEDWAYEISEGIHVPSASGADTLLYRYPGHYFYQEKYRDLPEDESIDAVDIMNGDFKERCSRISEGLDGLLERHGYKRTADGFYEPIRKNSDHIALFCHGGMLAHLLHLPVHYLIHNLEVMCTGVTTLYFNDMEGPVYNGAWQGSEFDPCVPVVYTVGDVGHLYSEGSGPLMHREMRVPY